MNFNELNMNEEICRALQEAGYQEPTPIQQKAIPSVLAGRDLMGCAQTGTGKTCAFAAPIIQRLSAQKEQKNRLRALILTPTRELALQIYENVCQYARYTSCTAVAVYGGVPQAAQVDAIQHGVDILIATPGRLWDLMEQGIVTLNRITCFVLDEADRMLDMGFFPDVRRIIRYLPAERQTLLFSATIPKEIAALANSLLRKPDRIAISPSAKPVEKIAQKVYFVERAEKRKLLIDIIRQSNVSQTLVFTRTRHGADRVSRELNLAGIKSKAIHSDKSQNQRQTALHEFKACHIAVLVATDIAARGIDISDLPLVINFELPNIPETYVHRIGRTGRAGQNGTAVSFCDHTERSYLVDIEKLTGCSIPVAGEIPHIPKTRSTSAQAVKQPAQPVQSQPVSTGTAKNQKAEKNTVSRGSQATRIKPGRRPVPRARLEAEERCVDAHTPSRSYALSREAQARIRKKIEEALARRAAQAAAPATVSAMKKNVDGRPGRGRRISRKHQ